MGDNIVEISIENETLKNKIGSNDENWLEEFTAILSIQIDYNKRANLNMSRMQKQMKKHLKNGIFFL